MRNLTELCNDVGITPAVMSKYQNKFKLGSGRPIGKGMGRRTYYDEETYKKYLKIKLCRMVDIPYEFIKNYCDGNILMKVITYKIRLEQICDELDLSANSKNIEFESC